MNINGISVSDNSAPWKKRKTQRSITETDFANRMADINRSNTVRQASDRTNGRKAISEAISRRDIYVNDTSGICSAGLYSKGNTSAAPEWNLPIETDRYRIEDASFLEGAAAYSITDKETGRSLYMREDQLVIRLNQFPGARPRDADVKLPENSNKGLLHDKTNTPANEQDSNTHNEIIVRPDGSRVLVITMDIAGTQTAMSLQISEPTDLQNDVSGQEDSSNEINNETILTSDEISGSFNEK